MLHGTCMPQPSLIDTIVIMSSSQQEGNLYKVHISALAFVQQWDKASRAKKGLVYLIPINNTLPAFFMLNHFALH